MGPRIQKARTVADGLQNDRWIRDISGALTVQVLLDYLLIWDLTRDVTLRPGVTDRLLWKWTSDQTFSTASAYRSFFIGQYSIPGAKILAKTRAPGKCKFFGWLPIHDRCWTQLPGGSDTASKMMTTALCAARILKPSHTFSSAAPSSGKFVRGTMASCLAQPDTVQQLFQLGRLVGVGPEKTPEVGTQGFRLHGTSGLLAAMAGAE